MDNQDKILSSLQKIQNDLDYIKQQLNNSSSLSKDAGNFKTIVHPRDSGSAKLDGNIETI